MQDTLERLRKATKSEVVPILPLLKQQCVDLALVGKIDGGLKNELSLASEQLQELVSSVQHNMNSAASKTSMTESKAASRRESIGGGGGGGTLVVGGDKFSATPSESNRSRRSSTTRRNSTSAGNTSKGWDDGPEIDMLQVRTIQKHLAMYIADLSLVVRNNSATLSQTTRFKVLALFCYYLA